MEVVTIKVGYLETNCYLLINNKKCLVVDPGDESNKIIDKIKENNLTVKGILITHNHQDHTGALNDIQTLCKCNVYQKANLNEGKNNINDFNFKVIYTPGHTKDCITYYFEKESIMITGDFLFKNTIGRYDLEDSSLADMKNSLVKIKNYNKDIVVYPGHGESTNMIYELRNNQYLIEV